MAKNMAAFGIYRTEEQAAKAVELLRNAGFRLTDISALIPSNSGTKDLKIELSSKAPEGAATGAASGAVLGGALGWLAGIGMLAIPGIGPFIAAGPIMAALAGVGAGATTGGIVGGLAGFGMPEYEAKRYEGMIKEGGILVSVHCDDSEWVTRAKGILQDTHATDIASESEATADFSKSDRPMIRSTSAH